LTLTLNWRETIWYIATYNVLISNPSSDMLGSISTFEVLFTLKFLSFRNINPQSRFKGMRIHFNQWRTKQNRFCPYKGCQCPDPNSDEITLFSGNHPLIIRFGGWNSITVLFLKDTQSWKRKEYLNFLWPWLHANVEIFGVLQQNEI